LKVDDIDLRKFEAEEGNERITELFVSAREKGRTLTVVVSNREEEKEEKE
jgi:hypothetical protein